MFHPSPLPLLPFSRHSFVLIVPTFIGMPLVLRSFVSHIQRWIKRIPIIMARLLFISWELLGILIVVLNWVSRREIVERMGEGGKERRILVTFNILTLLYLSLSSQIAPVLSTMSIGRPIPRNLLSFTAPCLLKLPCLIIVPLPFMISLQLHAILSGLV